MRISKIIIDYLEYLEDVKKASLKTVANYDHYLKRFIEFSNDVDISLLNSPLIESYRKYLSEYIDPDTNKPLLIKTQNYFLIALRAFLAYTSSLSKTTLGAESVALNKQEVSNLQILDEEYIEKLLHSPDVSTPDGLRDKTVMEVLFSTGLRVSELAGLNRSQILKGQKELAIIGKGGRKRIVFLNDSALKSLAEYLAIRDDPFEPLFIRYQGKKDFANNGEKMRLTTRSIERIIDRYAKLLDLPLKATPHSLRHSYAKELISSGADSHFIQQTLGHSSKYSIKVYSDNATAPPRSAIISEKRKE